MYSQNFQSFKNSQICQSCNNNIKVSLNPEKSEKNDVKKDFKPFLQNFTYVNNEIKFVNNSYKND